MHGSAILVGAQEGGLGDGLGAFLSSYRPIDADIAVRGPRQRARVRTFVRDNPHAKRSVRLLQRYVVGDGVSVHCAEEAITAAYAEHSLAENFTPSRQCSRAEIEGQVVSAMATDGEAFVRLLRSGKVRVIDTPRVPNDMLHRDGLAEIRNGIEYRGADGDRPVAYWVLPVLPYHLAYSVSYRRGEAERIPASQMCHVTLPLFATQARGWPELQTIIDVLIANGDYAAAEAAAAVLDASELGFINRDEMNTPPPTDGTAEDDDGYERQAFVAPAVGGQLYRTLPYGATYTATGRGRPSSEYANYTHEKIREAAAGADASYSALSGDSTANFSSLRAEALVAQEGFKQWQRCIIDRFVRPAFAHWLRREMMAGRFGGPSAFRTVLRETTFSGRCWTHLQPREEARAQELRLGLGLTALSDEIRRMGDDPERVFAQRAADAARLRSLGLPNMFEQEADAPPAGGAA